MRKYLVLIVFFSALVSGSEKNLTPEPNAAQVQDSEFAYLLTHMKVESESPLPDELPEGSKFAYRILGVTQQGSCIDGCPPSTIYIATSNYHDHQDGKIKLCRVNGLRFYSKVRVKEFKPAGASGPFLVFEVRSNPEPRVSRLYVVSVGQESCSITFSREFKNGI